MPQALEAVFDGTALQLEEPLNLAAGTRVTIIIESVYPMK
ncbi:MAG: antitoxin family protein [Microcystis sp.]